MVQRKWAAILGIVGLVACEAPPGQLAEPEPDLRLFNARIEHYRGGALVLSATAERAEYQREPQLAELFNARFDLPGSPPALAFARSVHYDARTQQGGAAGSLRLISAGDRLESDRAAWDGIARRLIGDAPIQLRSQNMQLNAPRWTVDVGTRALQLEGGVCLEILE